MVHIHAAEPPSSSLLHVLFHHESNLFTCQNHARPQDPAPAWLAGAASAVYGSPPKPSRLATSDGSSSAGLPQPLSSGTLQSQLSPAAAQLAELRGLTAELRAASSLEEP